MVGERKRERKRERERQTEGYIYAHRTEKEI